MKKFGMLHRLSSSLKNDQVYILFTCFLKSKKKKLINKTSTNTPARKNYQTIAKTTNLYFPS